MRNEELAKLTRVGYPTSSGARGKTQGQGTESLAEFEAEPHSA